MLGLTLKMQDQKVVAQFGISEGVTSATFTCANSRSPMLIAAVAGKWIRAYDIRLPSPAGSSSMGPPSAFSTSQANTWASKSLMGLCGDPFDENAFCSFGEGKPAFLGLCINSHAVYQMPSFEFGT